MAARAANRQLAAVAFSTRSTFEVAIGFRLSEDYP
jgi:hypothetical protein